MIRVPPVTDPADRLRMSPAELIVVPARPAPDGERLDPRDVVPSSAPWVAVIVAPLTAPATLIVPIEWAVTAALQLAADLQAVQVPLAGDRHVGAEVPAAGDRRDVRSGD
jgi:hypothetical protein